jgi:hypothetical protein
VVGGGESRQVSLTVHNKHGMSQEDHAAQTHVPEVQEAPRGHLTRVTSAHLLSKGAPTHALLRAARSFFSPRQAVVLATIRVAVPCRGRACVRCQISKMPQIYSTAQAVYASCVSSARPARRAEDRRPFWQRGRHFHETQRRCSSRSLESVADSHLHFASFFAFRLTL